MDCVKIIQDNSEAINNSFLYFLHEWDVFKQHKLTELCNAIENSSIKQDGGQEIASKVTFIYGQILKHIIFHFDPSDGSHIKNLPVNYSDCLEELDKAVLSFLSSR